MNNDTKLFFFQSKNICQKDRCQSKCILNNNEIFDLKIKSQDLWFKGFFGSKFFFSQMILFKIFLANKISPQKCWPLKYPWYFLWHFLMPNDFAQIQMKQVGPTPESNSTLKFILVFEKICAQRIHVQKILVSNYFEPNKILGPKILGSKIFCV